MSEFPSQIAVTRSFDIFSLIFAWTDGWVNNRDAGDLSRHRAHYGVTVVLEDRGTSIYLYPLCANLLERTDWGGILWEQLLTSLFQYVPHILKSPEVSKLTDLLLNGYIALEGGRSLSFADPSVKWCQCDCEYVYPYLAAPRLTRSSGETSTRNVLAIALLYGKDIKPK